MNKDAAIAYVKNKLNHDPEFYDYSLLAFVLRDHVDPNDKDLKTLAWELSSGQYGCSKSEVEDLLELIEGGTDGNK